MWEGRSPDSSGSSLIATTDVKDHARRRKFWNRAFTQAALKDYEDFIAKRATQLVELLSVTPVADMNSWFARFT